MATSFSGRRSQSTRREPPTMGKPMLSIPKNIKVLPTSVFVISMYWFRIVVSNATCNNISVISYRVFNKIVLNRLNWNLKWLHDKKGGVVRGACLDPFTTTASCYFPVDWMKGKYTLSHWMMSGTIKQKYFSICVSHELSIDNIIIFSMCL
jgi:hypothetical protein